MAKVAVSCPLPGDALELLGREHDVSVIGAPGATEPGRMHEAMQSSEAVLTMLTDPIPRAAIARAAGRLKVIANCAVGFDNVDVVAAAEHQVMVVNTPNVLTEASADFAFALIMAAARRVPEADRFVRAGRFRGFRLDLMLGRPLHGATLGIVGLGRIGSAVARRARGFDMRVLYTQRHRAENEFGAEWVDKSRLFSESDVVTLHAPLSPETRHYVDRDALARMKADAILVNTARGPLVDEHALADALGQKRLFAAALDVFEREPQIEARLCALENIVLTPHIASATEPTRAAMARAVAEDILRVLRGEAPRNRVA